MRIEYGSLAVEGRLFFRLVSTDDWIFKVLLVMMNARKQKRKTDLKKNTFRSSKQHSYGHKTLRFSKTNYD